MNNKALDPLPRHGHHSPCSSCRATSAAREDEVRKKFGAEILVVKASRDIKEQETINEKMLELEKIPKTFLEPSAVSFDKGTVGDTEVTKSLKSLTGSVALVPIKKGEQIAFSKLSEPGIRTGLSPQVTPAAAPFARAGGRDHRASRSSSSPATAST